MAGSSPASRPLNREISCRFREALRLGDDAAFDGKRILLEKPEVGVYADGMMIVVSEQGEIDVNGRSLGPVRSEHANAKKHELIAEIISHFDL